MVTVFVTRITFLRKQTRSGHGYVRYRLGFILNGVKDPQTLIDHANDEIDARFD
jgi:hypothetical protein